jgi:hypothetical protein
MLLRAILWVVAGAVLASTIGALGLTIFDILETRKRSRARRGNRLAERASEVLRSSIEN